MSVTLSLIVAHARNRVIGNKNALPWRLPADLQHFKAVTMGKPIVMGRKTFESIGRALPGRLNIVITRQRDFQAEGTVVVGSVEEAIQVASTGADEVMVIGGEEIYRATMQHAGRIYRTLVEADPEGDAYFPELEDGWRVVEEELFAADPLNQFPYRFQIMEPV